MGPKNIYFLFAAGFFTLAPPAFCLVDYSEDSASSSSSAPVRSARSEAPTISSSALSNYTSSQGKAQKSSRPMIFSLSPRYEVISVEKPNRTSKVNVTELEAVIFTPWSFHFDLKYGMYSTTDQELSEDSGNQKGNPELKVGIDWLDFGSAQDRTTVTLITGASLAASNSTLGSSRTDKIVGLETAKRFYRFGLGLGYELRIVGTPKDETEKAIGNINHLYAGIDYEMSNDINVGVMADNFNVSPSSDTGRANYLAQKVSFSSLGTSLTLNPGLFSIELGARFNTKRVKSPEALASARLWSLPGAYGNTIFTSIGLNF